MALLPQRQPGLLPQRKAQLLPLDMGASVRAEAEGHQQRFGAPQGGYIPFPTMPTKEQIGQWALQNPLDAAALATSPIPVVGDVVGFAADANALYNDPSWSNAGWMAAGLLPFVPAGTVKRVGGDVADYQGMHKPMEIGQGSAPLSNLEDLMPDIYGKNALQYYGSGDVREAAVLDQIRKVRGNPDAEVTIYRGVPKGADKVINPGDWVTLSPDYAADYGDVVSKKVKASELGANADSLLEQGYFPQSLPTDEASRMGVSKARGRAIAGGEVGINGYLYKGGQFLPITDAPPGTYRVKQGKKAQNLGAPRGLAEPGKIESGPSPFSRPIFETIKDFVAVGDDGKLSLLPHINWEYFGNPFTDKQPMRFKNLAQSTEEFSIQDKIDLYNQGARWIELEPLPGVEVIAKGEK